MSNTNSSYVVANLLDKLSQPDPDYRFMACSDLYAELSKPQFVFDSTSELSVIQHLVKALCDSHSEVQNTAIKCLVPLSQKISDVIYTTNLLADMLQQKDKESSILKSEIGAMALRIVLTNIPKNHVQVEKVVAWVFPLLLSFCSQAMATPPPAPATRSRSNATASKKVTPSTPISMQALVEVLDTIQSLLQIFGSSIPHSSHEACATQLLALLEHPRGVVRKKAISALGALAAAAPTLSGEIIRTIHKNLTACKASETEQMATLLAAGAMVCRSSSTVEAKSLEALVRTTVDLTKRDDDDLKEGCMTCLEVFCGAWEGIESSPLLNEVVQLAVGLIGYDPNYIEDDEEDEDSMDVDGEGSDMDAEEEDEEEYSDADDVSWKVRRASLKLVTFLVTKTPSLLPSFYASVSPVLIRRFGGGERQEVVRVECLKGFKEIVEATGRQLAPTHIMAIRKMAAVPALSAASGVSKSTKRRKGSNGEQVSDTEMAMADSTRDDLIGLLSAQIPAIVNALSKQFQTSNSTTTIFNGFALIKELVNVLSAGRTAGSGLDIDNAFGMVVNAIRKALSSSTVPNPSYNTDIEIEVLELLGLMITTHSYENLQPYLSTLVAGLCDASLDKFYKVRSGALSCMGTIVSSVLEQNGTADPSNATSAERNAAIMQTIFTCAWTLVTSPDEMEAEVSDQGLLVIADIVRIDSIASSTEMVPDTISSDQILQVLQVILTRVKSDVSARKVGGVLALNVMCTGNTKVSGSMPPQLINDFLSEIRPMITQNNKQSVVAALTLLVTLVRNSSTRRLDASVYFEILSDLDALLGVVITSAANAATDAGGGDLQVCVTLGFDLLLQLLQVGINEGPRGKGTMAKTLVNSIVPKIITIMTKHSHVVQGGAGLVGLLSVWECLLGGTKPDSAITGVYENGVMELVKIASGNHGAGKEALAVMAKCVAKASRTPQIASLIKHLSQNLSGGYDERLQSFSIACLGEIGMETDMTVFAPKLHETVNLLIISKQGAAAAVSDDIKNGCAIAIGQFAVGNVAFYLPLLVNAIKLQNYEYYYILSVNEMLTQFIARGNNGLNYKVAAEMWNLLFTVVVSVAEDGTKSLISDCLGKIFLDNLEKFLPLLLSLLGHEHDVVRSTVVLAFRYSLSHPTSSDYDNQMHPCIMTFLDLLKDPSHIVRKQVSSALFTCIRSKPYLLLDGKSGGMRRLAEIVPLIFRETILVPELVKEVMMGPFKHKVDAGLDNRKVAYDCLSSLLDTFDLPEAIMKGLVTKVTQGINDEAMEIKIASNLLLQKLAQKHARYLDFTRFEDQKGLTGLHQTIFAKVKDTAVKQELENVRMQVSSCLKTVIALDRVFSGAGVATRGKTGVKSQAAAVHPAWDAFVEELRKSAHGAMLKELEEES